MTSKHKKGKTKSARAKAVRTKPARTKPVRTKRGRIDRLWASVDDELWMLADEKSGPGARWNRPQKQRISLRVDREVVDWFKSKGPGYQTRINRILRRVMIEGKKRTKEG
jgi:uncharacterized protein (DUF4415 family)